MVVLVGDCSAITCNGSRERHTYIELVRIRLGSSHDDALPEWLNGCSMRLIVIKFYSNGFDVNNAEWSAV